MYRYYHVILLHIQYTYKTSLSLSLYKGIGSTPLSAWHAWHYFTGVNQGLPSHMPLMSKLLLPFAEILFGNRTNRRHEPTEPNTAPLLLPGQGAPQKNNTTNGTTMRWQTYIRITSKPPFTSHSFHQNNLAVPSFDWASFCLQGGGLVLHGFSMSQCDGQGAGTKQSSEPARGQQVYTWRENRG